MKNFKENARIIFVISIVAAFLVFARISCVDKDGTINILASQGYVNIKITGYDFFCCSEDDVFHTGFEAQSPNGSFVKGTVCKGWLKGATIRFK